VNIQEYIESGALEAYVTGSATEAEAGELLRFKEEYPEIQNALKQLEQDMEFVAGSMAISPPPAIWDRISNDIDDLIFAPKHAPLHVIPGGGKQERDEAPEREKYLEVEYQSSHMRVHKNWKWVFAAVFILSKIFLACAIYFYLENRQAEQQVQDLKTELKQLKIK